ncbi:MAG: hypothetical protein O2816_10830 [Planctomycetota bacterium]|nr:hypothetical protein [Planctomycetota bacterium]
MWYAAAKPLIEEGLLRVVGITQEQHPDRCELYAQWQGYDFPILWDPFNLTQSTAVPMAMGVDGAGVLRDRRVDARSTDKLRAFTNKDWIHDVVSPAQPYPGVTLEVARTGVHGRNLNSARQAGVALLLFHRVLHGTPPDAKVFETSLLKIGGYAGMEGAAVDARFHLGVAHRLRYDSEHSQGSDFQASLDAWLGALLENPGQYIWRRRIQQWGPRLDKPYPFYDWVATAQAELTERGETPVVVRVPLTGSEVAGSTKEIPLREQEDLDPDPKGRTPRDTRGLVTIESAAALHTGIASKRVREPAGTARIHLVLKPGKNVHWGNEAGPATIWVEVPEGWNVRRQLWTLPLPEEVSTSEVRRIDFEVRPPLGPPTPGTIRGVAYYPLCEGEDGTCNLWAQPFEVTIPLPDPGDGDDDDEDDEDGGADR